MAARKRRRLSSVDLLPQEQREYVEQVLRRRDLTLDDMLEDIRAKFPGTAAEKISRSALHRFDLKVEEFGKDIREIEASARAVVSELGEGFGEKSADYLTQAITVLGVRAAAKAKDDPEMSIKDAKDLAQMAKNTMDARRMNVAQRKMIQQEARDKLLREQEAKLDKVAKSGKYDPATLQRIRSEVYGLQ